MAVTLRDVAQRAGVSVRTVSNVVNGFQHISPAMRVRVQAALDELEYTPNLLARSLRQGRTGIITLLVPEIAVPYFGELAHEVVEQAGSLGCTVLIDETGGEPAREKALLDVAARSGWVDGVLLSSLGLKQRDLAALGTGTPVVLLGERTAKSVLDHVGIDNVGAARLAVRHLVESGRRRIAAIGGSGGASDTTSRLRLKGYRQELRSVGLPFEDLAAGTPDYKPASGADAVRTLLERAEPPDALFCFSDELAVGALRALYEAGVRVPDEISVVGFDDVEASRFTTPSLTSIRPDRAGIARSALEMLLQRLDTKDTKDTKDIEPRDVRVGHELIVRESSTRVPH